MLKGISLHSLRLMNISHVLLRGESGQLGYQNNWANVDKEGRGRKKGEGGGMSRQGQKK